MMDKQRRHIFSRLTIALILAILLVVIFGWVKFFVLDKSMADTDENEHLDVAIIIKGTQSGFWKDFLDGVETAASEYNVQYYVESPDNEEDYEYQNRMMREAIDNKVDIIILSAISAEDIDPLVDEASQNGIKVIVVDSGVNTNSITSEIGTNNYEAGVNLGKTVEEMDIDHIYVGIVNFDVNSANGQEREKGFRDEIKNDSRIVVVDTINVESNTTSTKQGTINLLSKYPEINVIVTMNEWTTLGVGYAIQELECAGSVQVYGFDRNTFCLDMLELGYLDGLVIQNPFAMGYLGIESAYSIYNGSKTVPSKVDTQTIIVTRENLYEEDIQKLVFPVR